MQDLVITCIQCGTEFEFTIKEQLRFKKMKFDDPKRCRSCRKNKSRPSGSRDNRFNNKNKYYGFHDE
jgi:hypothetical protein